MKKTIGRLMILALTASFMFTCVENKVENPYVAISSIEFSETTIDMYVGDQRELVVNVLPENYTDSQVFSSDNNCVSVDSNGVVTAEREGTAIVTAMSGDYAVSAKCTINISGDYVDEHGINRGKGIQVYGVVWAPVNCGYHETDFPWGKLYQWGRSDGQALQVCRTGLRI